VTGGITLYYGFATTVDAARMFCLIMGEFYLILSIVGFIAPVLLAASIQAHGIGSDMLPDNIVHLLFGVAFLIVGWLRMPHPTAHTELKA
jgi:hypothetical protein